MMNFGLLRSTRRVKLLAATMLAGTIAMCGLPQSASADDGTEANSGQLPLPSGQYITPLAATGAVTQTMNPGFSWVEPSFLAGGAENVALSPDGNTLLVLCSGYNLVTYTYSNQIGAGAQLLFVFDVSGANAAAPVQKQAIWINSNTFVGLAWKPDSSAFYVTGGNDDNIKIFAGSTATGWGSNHNNTTPTTTISLGHTANLSGTYNDGTYGTQYYSWYSSEIGDGLGITEGSITAGIALSSDGSLMVVANQNNASITVLNTATNTKKFEYDLRPYNTSNQAGVAGGEVPYGVAIKGTGANAVAYVSSIRDREIDVVNIGGTTPSLITRIAVPGTPNNMVLSADQTRLYVAQDNSDTVSVINTANNVVIAKIPTAAPAGTIPTANRYFGASPNNLALSPDNKTLYVTNGGNNSVAIIPLSTTPYAVAASIPTAWYPTGVAVSKDGAHLYVVNFKDDPGPNPGYQSGSYSSAGWDQQYVLQLEHSNLTTIPTPSSADYASLTAQVAANNFYNVAANANDTAVMSALHSKIQHVIYIIKENRTFDQILGDLNNGANADSAIVEFGQAVTPNLHAIATNFVTLDNFFCSGEVSGNGWPWSTAARESDFGTRVIPMEYANRGDSNDAEGTNHGVNVGLATQAARNAAYGPYNFYDIFASSFPGGITNFFPGTNNDFATDGPAGSTRQTGYLWDSALRAGLTVRNYGAFIDEWLYGVGEANYGLNPNGYASEGYLENPYQYGVTVATPTNPTLAPYTDIYFRGFDNAFPDAWREEEWAREFNQYVTNNNLPNLTILRLMHDHMGNFSGSDGAVAGLTTGELQVADNDLAVGEVVQTVANSPYAGNTLIFVVEDDAQDGPDHMDAHRSTAYIVGPYVKKNAVVTTRYTTVNLVRTIEDVLGIDHLNLNDTYQRPMTDVFDLTQTSWSYTATASSYLSSTSLATKINAAGISFADNTHPKPTRDQAYWAWATRGFDFSAADRAPAMLFNHVVWDAMKPGVPYPTVRSGKIIRRGKDGAPLSGS